MLRKITAVPEQCDDLAEIFGEMVRDDPSIRKPLLALLDDLTIALL